MSGAGKLTLSDRGGGNGFTIDHAGAECSWAISQPGTFRCILRDKDARQAGAAGANWIGSKWLRWTYPDLPVWGGVVTITRWSPGILELAAESFHVLARKRRVPRTYGQQRATAGALAQRAYRDVQADDYTFLRNFYADEWGDPVDYEWRGGDLHDDVWRELASASGQEFTVDAERDVYWRVRLGSDKSGRLCLSYPHEIVDYPDLTGDLWTVENDIEGIAADTKYADSAYDRLDHDASVKLRGRYMTTRRYPHVVTKGTLRPKLKADLNRLNAPSSTVTLTVANVAHVWGEITLGDTFGALIPGANSRLNVRALAMSVDAESQLMTIGGQVV